ncbi:unnamed protein product [Pleuronectes platessa]|uniref:Uncharacterized protein n=1 Tax=Pleuronectes platessa TaxID=8262 RepID=A0A9N7TPU8_PLEPL|nr:unnamed protein product [Pleuronectes platessa]
MTSARPPGPLSSRPAPRAEHPHFQTIPQKASPPSPTLPLRAYIPLRMGTKWVGLLWGEEEEKESSVMAGGGYSEAECPPLEAAALCTVEDVQYSSSESVRETEGPELLERERSLC